MTIPKNLSSTAALVTILLTMMASTCDAFMPASRKFGGISSSITTTAARTRYNSASAAAAALHLANINNNDAESADDLRRYDKARRAADVNSRVVELVRPLGMILNEDKMGNVYVEAIAPKGNAARSGVVQEGDIVTMCSATFGDQMWSTRGVGLSRVLAAIRVRAGGTVKLCLESPQETKRKAQLTKAQLQQMEDARRTAQEKKDRLLQELEQDEQRLKKGKFLGLF